MLDKNRKHNVRPLRNMILLHSNQILLSSLRTQKLDASGWYFAGGLLPPRWPLLLWEKSVEHAGPWSDHWLLKLLFIAFCSNFCRTTTFSFVPRFPKRWYVFWQAINLSECLLNRFCAESIASNCGWAVPSVARVWNEHSRQHKERHQNCLWRRPLHIWWWVLPFVMAFVCIWTELIPN